MSATQASPNPSTTSTSAIVDLLRAMGLSAVQVSSEVVALCTTLPKAA